MNLMLDENDIKAYIGAIIIMSISPVWQLSHYWSNNERCHNSYMSSRISSRHFHEISKMFHISIPSQEVAGDKICKVYNMYDIYIIYTTDISNDNCYIYLHAYLILSDPSISNVQERNFAKLYSPNQCLSMWRYDCIQRSA